MSEANWPAAFAFVLLQEGGYSSNPQDPGGITNLGITIDEWRRWTRDPNISADDMRALTTSAVKPLYHQMYWLAARCNDLPPGVDTMVFDMAVNTGVRRAAMMLQEAASAAPVDGLIGPVTLSAVRSESASWLIETLAIKRRAFYRSLPTFDAFGKGWLNRVNAACTAALALAQ